MAPALRIPISANMQEFEQGMEKARSTTIRSVKFIAQQFASLNKEMAAGGVAATALGTGVVGATARMALGLTTSKVAVAAFALAVGAAIAEAGRQLEEMIKISDKVGVSAEFFQGFLLAARDLKLEAKDLEGALTRAFEATKERIDQTLPLLDRLKEFFLGGLVGEGARGLDLFRGAQNQDQKVRAILVAMTELEAAGQRLAALDIGERMFGAAFVDKIRQGKTSAVKLLDDIDEVSRRGVASGSIFSEETVNRAKEIDRQLKMAHQTLEKNLRPAWEGLAETALTIKSVWADIVVLLAKAAGILEVFGKQYALDKQEGQRAAIETLMQNEKLSEAARAVLINRLNTLNAALGRRDSQRGIGSEFSSDPTVGGYAPPPVPLPRSNPLKITEGHTVKFPDAKESARSEADAFTRTQDSLEKRIALEGAVAESVGKTNEEREYAKALAEQWAAAERAGLPITAELIIQMSELADRWGEVSAQSDRAKDKFQEFQDASRELGSGLSEAFKSAILHGKSLGDVIKTLTDRLASKSIDKLFDLFFASPSGGGGSTVGNFLSLIFGGGKAGGGPVDPGKVYAVGEKGPEFFVPKTAGIIVPNDVVRAGSPSAGSTQMDNRRSYNIDARGAQAGVAQQIVAALRAYDRQLPGRITEMQMTGV